MNDDDFIDYGKLIDEAMRSIVIKALHFAKTYGLPGEHHFYVTFLTDYPGVMIDDALRAQYPDEMTIVLQHQYWNLEVEDHQFSIVLSFNHVKHNLTVPFAAVTAFADPSVKFGLQFRQFEDEIDEALEDGRRSANEEKGTGGNGTDSKGMPENKDNVISLDSFRKK